jgi:hypothetical protein
MGIMTKETNQHTGILLRRLSAFALACSMAWSAPSAYALRQTGVQESPDEREKLTSALTQSTAPRPRFPVLKKR